MEFRGKKTFKMGLTYKNKFGRTLFHFPISQTP